MDQRPLMRRSRFGNQAACLLLLAAATLAHGRVFEFLGRSGGGSYDALPGWTRAYSETWTINGGRTDIEVWSASETLAATVDRLRSEAARRGDIAAFSPGDTLAWGVTEGGGRIVRFLCTAMESGRQTIVFRFSQTEADSRRSAAGRVDAKMPGDVPVPPGAKPEFVATSAESGTTLGVFTVDSSPADARNFLANSLQQAGWTPAAGPPAAFLNGTVFYIRGASICGYAIKMSGQNGSCVVTVLHRRLASGETD